jgi:FkbH-like protein
MTTRRYTEADIRQFLKNPGYLVRGYSLEDRFGDNGIISVVIIKKEKESWYLDTFLMSCRVIGRTVESAILALLAQEAREANVESMIGDFLPTKKNILARDIYPQHAFEKVQENSGNIRYKLELANTNLSAPEWFEITHA